MKRSSILVGVSVLLLAIAFLASSSFTSRAHSEDGAGGKFEYLFYDQTSIARGPSAAATALNFKGVFDTLGQDRWEYVGLSMNNDYFIFKRRR